MIHLHQTFGAHAGRSLTFDQPVVRCGRQPDSDVAFDPNADLDASGRHAEFVREPTGWAIRDVGSRNGTWVNGDRISRVVLKDGDEIEFGPGGPRFRVELPVDVSAPTARPPAPVPAAPVVAPALAARAHAPAAADAHRPTPAPPRPTHPQPGLPPAGGGPKSRGRMLIAGGIGCSLLGLLAIAGALGLWWMHNKRVPGPTAEDATRIAHAHAGALLIAFTRDNNNSEHEACAAFAVRPDLLATTSRCVMQMQAAGARGEHAFARAPGAAPIPVTLMYRHPGFVEGSAESGTMDVGLLRLQTPAPTLASLAPSPVLAEVEAGQPVFMWAAAHGGGGLRGDRIRELGDFGSGPGQRLGYDVQATAGSPIFDREGRVIGVHAGAPGGEAVAGYGVRADVLAALIAGL